MSQLGCVTQETSHRSKRRALGAEEKESKDNILEGRRGVKAWVCSTESVPEKRRGRGKVWVYSREKEHTLGPSS